VTAVALRREAGLFLKFGLVGVLGFAVDAIVLEAAVRLGLPPAGARVVSVLVAMHATFLVNGLLVFGGFRRERLARQWIAYLAANALGAACNYGLFVALVWSGLPLLSERIVALAAGSALGWGINFAGTRLVAFRP
jgi:putative flippase GtrA